MPNNSDMESAPGVFSYPAGGNFVYGYNGPGRVTLFGHSYLDPNFGVSSPVIGITGGLIDYNQSLFRQVLAALGVDEVRATNYGIGGAAIILDNSLIPGGHVTVLQRYSPMNIRQASPGSRAPWTTSLGLCVFVYGVNDITHYGGGNQHGLYRKNFKEAWRTSLSRARAAAVYEETDTDFTLFSGGGLGGAHWSSIASTTINSGSGYARTATVGASVTLSVPSDSDSPTVALGFIGRTGATGGQATVSIDGVIVDRIDTSNVTANSINAAGTNEAATPLVLTRRYNVQPLTAHTIVVTVTGVDGNFEYDFMQFEAAEANPLIVANIPKLRVYPNGKNQDIVTDDWSEAISETLKEFPKPWEIADFDTALNQSQAQSTYNNNRLSFDNTHPSETGSQYLAASILNAWNRINQSSDSQSISVTPQDTIGYGSYLPVSPPGVNFFLDSPPLTPNGVNAALTPGNMVAIPIIITQPCSVDKFVLANCSAVGGSGNMRIGLMSDRVNSDTWRTGGFQFGPGIKLYDWGLLTLTAAPAKTLAIPAGQNRILVPGVYWLCMILQNGATASVLMQSGNHPYVRKSSILAVSTACAGYEYGIGGGFTTIPVSLSSATMTQATMIQSPLAALNVSSVP